MSEASRSSVIVGVLLGCAAFTAYAADLSNPVNIELPAETARLKPGPGVDTALGSCMTCHSVDYIYMQPPLTTEQWRGEVLKMKNVFGAPFPENDVDAIVTYLMSQNGKQ